MEHALERTADAGIVVHHQDERHIGLLTLPRAITRRAPTDSTAGPPWIPEEVVDLTTMLKAYTIEGARAAFDERIDGTIETGKAADLVVLDRDLYRIPVQQIHRARVLLTLLDGREVYRDRTMP